MKFCDQLNITPEKRLVYMLTRETIHLFAGFEPITFKSPGRHLFLNK